MVAASELHGDFVLSSGTRSSVYFDKFPFLTDPGLLRDVAKAAAALLPDGVTALGAPEGAAMLLVAAVSLETGLPVTIVRKQAKGYGTKAQVEGTLTPGATVALIEDVSRTAHPVQRAAEVPPAAGAEIGAILVAIYRWGAAPLRAAGFVLRAVAVRRPKD